MSYMNVYRIVKRAAFEATIVMLMGGFSGKALAADGAWVYQYADLAERFHEISASEKTASDRQAQYAQLLKDCSAFATTPTEDARERRARKMASLIMQRRIGDQLADPARLEHVDQELDSAKEALPEAERSIFRFLERSLSENALQVQPSCMVIGKAGNIQAKALDYPITDLLKKMAGAATGRVQVPSEVSGVADYDSHGWNRAEAAIAALLRSRGLDYRGNYETGWQVIIHDPLYTASLAERALSQVSHVTPKKPERGIQSGYLILQGIYVRPPYETEVRANPETCGVFINNLQIGASYRLTPQRAADQPVRGRIFKLADKAELCAFVGEQYVVVSTTRGHKAGIEAITIFLKTQPSVSSWKMNESETELWITFADDSTLVAGLPGPEKCDPTEVPELEKSKEEIRKRGLAQAEEARAAIEAAFNANGLVLVPTNGPIMIFDGNRANKVLQAICHCLDEAERMKVHLTEELFAAPWVTGASGWTWEIFLNTRHHELAKRMAEESQR